MNKNLKRRIYAIALAGVLLTTPKITAYADEVDMTPVDIESAISELVPGYTDNNNNNNNNNNDNNNGTKNNSSNSEECKHVYPSVADDVINQKTPSCTESGSYDEVYYCEKCGTKEIRHFEIPAPGHKWDEGTKTITSNGYEITYHCTNKGCDATTKKTYENTPTEPTKTTTPTEPGKNDVPKTGDSSPIIPCAAIAVASGLGAIAVGLNMNKEDKKEKYKGKYLSKRK